MTNLIVIEYHRFYLHGGQQSFLYLLVATFSFSLWMIILILQGPYPHSRYMVLYLKIRATVVVSNIAPHF